jgi:DNA replication protein DnaC
MLNHPTLEKLSQLKLYTMARTLQTQMEMPEYTELGFEERLGLLVDCEMTAREEKRLQRRLGSAKLRQNACMEDIDFGIKRGLDKSLILNLATCHWVAKHRNILITGPTGAGKSWLACALGNKACREGYSVSYKRSLRLFNELSLARVDG